jgi:hypothetical protein
VSTVTGVQVTPPPTMRLTRRHCVPDGGIAETGFAHAGDRSLVRNAVTKPRTPYSEPAAAAERTPYATEP